MSIFEILTLFFSIHAAYGQLRYPQTTTTLNGQPTPLYIAREGGEINEALADFNARPLRTYTIYSANPLPTLIYNCHYVPSLCRNVNAVPGGNNREYVFDRDTNRKDWRRDDPIQGQCPSNWAQQHPCPEADQPAAVLGESPNLLVDLYPVNYIEARFANGILVPGTNVRTNNMAVNLPTRPRDYNSPNPQYPKQQCLGATWSCDEFPPASWVQGGFGGHTYCAPIRSKRRCGQGGKTPVQTEQNWQGTAHNTLRTHMEAKMRAAGVLEYDELSDGGTLFAFHFQTENVGGAAAACRIVADGQYFNYGPFGRNQNPVTKRGEPMLSLLQGDNSDSLKFTRRESNGTVIGLDQPDYGVNGSFLGLPNPYPVHQSPGKNHPIPIMAISEEYILGQLSTNKSTNATSSHSNQTFTGGNAQSKRKSLLSRGFTKILPLNKRDGPIQCGPGSPCLDGSCCNSDGKCGYGSSHCNSTVCISNCDATAMCGRDSLNGTVQCGLNICCSYYGWCGTTDTYCGNPDGLSPCQANFGSCQVISDPSCSASGGSSSGRTIGYYQSWNMRNRLCNKVMPSQIITDGLTHLNFAFLYFDPITFRAVPMDDADLLLYSAFTALKKPGLQTWISVGGWAFSDPGPTQHAWSDMVASSANRYQFISSLISFMTQYGFDGADLDWEYPSAEARGGRSGDAANFVTLVKEMKSAFNGYFGLSAVLAPDYTYISGSDPKGMEPYVDFFGFMAYDLHGAWDKSIPSLGAHVRAQTDIRDIDNDLRPLWFDGVDPSKINLGLAYYGRTYTLSDPSCGTFNCSYEDYGRAKFCTNFAGVLSLQEIKSMVSANDITPTLSNEAMVKYATYDTDQWVGYDDEETLALKRAYANSKCLGGTMIWSIDFYGNGSGNVPQSGAGVEHMSPTSATVIPLPVTSVASTATFTVDNPAASNVAVLSNEGDQNLPPGPGFANCNYCDLMRLITSTCCGIGGSVANPILILPEVPLPADLVLPAGFQPSSGFYSNAGIYYPPYTPLPNTVTIPSGTKFPVAFPIPAGYGLNEGGSNSTAVVVYINTTFWQNPPYVVSCSYPCTFVLPPYPVQTTWTPPATTTTIDGTTITTQPPVQTSEHIYVSKITVHTTDPATKTTSITTGDPACPVYTIPLALFDLPITVCPPPPLPPFPPAISLEFPGIPPPPITILSAPTPGPTTPGNVPPDNPEEENDDEENDESCPIDGSPEFSDDEPDDNNSYNDNTGSGTDTSVPPFTPTVVTSVTVTTTTLPPPPPTTITETVVITATPTATRPPAPPEPPTPQPGTQQLHCFNSGNSENRAYMINAIEGFCTGGRDKNWNELIPPDGTVSNDVFFLYSMWVTDKSIIQVSIQAKNGCSFKLQGGSATQYCGKMLRRLVDECNTNDVKYKQGGTLEDNCSLWTMDPGEIFGPVNNPCYKRGVPGPWPSCDFWTGTPKYTCGWCP